MLTGNNRTTSEAVSRRLGITKVEAEVLPEDKYRIVERLKAEGQHVAIESAGVTLLGGDLTGIVQARRLSRAVLGNIPAESVLCLCLQRCGHTNRSGHA